MSEESSSSADRCTVCGRGILPGEATRAFITSSGGRADVCPLCKDRAVASGWVPADRATSLPSGGAPSQRRPGAGMRELLERAGIGTEGLRRRTRRARTEAEPETGGSRGTGGDRAQGAQATAESPAPRSRERRVRAALEAFNAGDHRRTVAGLSRSLGEPRVSAVPVGKHGTVRLTVAWELSWYQWQAIPEGETVRVREHAKGSEIAQLSPHDRAWNAAVAADGKITLAQTRSRDEAKPPK